MRPHLEPEGNRFRPGWGAALFSEPPGMDVKKRRKPGIHRGGVSPARGGPCSPGPRLPCPCPQGALRPEARTQESASADYKKEALCVKRHV